MVNDATYLLDESLAGLVKINQIENEMNNSFEWLFAGNQYRRSRENELDAVEGRVTIYISGAHTTMELLMMFTKETKGPYVMPGNGLY
jgi:ubiquitin conjugation factor E4 B